MASGRGRLKQPPSRIKAAPYTVRLAPDAERTTRDNAPWRNWYGLAEWRRLRMQTFERDSFTCRMCGRLQGDTSKLTCDHIRPHRGNRTLFFDPANLQTLCTEPCHVKHKQAQEQESRQHIGTWD